MKLHKFTRYMTKTTNNINQIKNQPQQQRAT